MNPEEEKKKILDDLTDTYARKDYLKLANIMVDLCKNNYFLEGERSPYFDWGLRNICYYVDRNYDDVKNRKYYDLYFSVIGKTISFMKENIDDNNLTRYAFLQSLLVNNYFSKEENKWLDGYKDFKPLLGINVLLGKSRCRHKAVLLKDIFNNYTDTLTIPIGEDAFNLGDHSIISFEHNNRRLFLDSVSPTVFYPIDNLTLFDINEDKDKYIKSVFAYIDNNSFSNVDDYYKFFNNLYDNSSLSEDGFKEIITSVRSQYYMFENDIPLLEDFKRRISPEHRALRRYNKKITG